MKLMDWIKKIFDFLKTAFEQLIKDLLANGQIREFMKEAGNIVREEVLEADELDIPGADKNKIAFDQIKTRLEATGKSFATWLINWGIENIVASIRTKIES